MSFTETPVDPLNEDGKGSDFINPPGMLKPLRTALVARYQKLLDDIHPYVWPRWVFTLVLLILYTYRVYYAGGWYIVSYALAIYILNLFIGFLAPAVDPEIEPMLPTKNDDEFRPFVRKLPEFKFWYAGTRAFLIALFCTMFTFLNIPVFWPILLIYFVALFAFTMKTQIKHMLKHGYVPITLGKPKFKGKKDST
eukprot:TRINITY_DN207_c0_g1_i1.p1 TRINITY_DN207_c0_g1~~TRINITY_DN207_c0_g1_i1.p1  ORF type:complete len:195 (-),score=15.97 TRINITY_DN207_c0_g1_i1:80-664(-)